MDNNKSNNLKKPYEKYVLNLFPKKELLMSLKKDGKITSFPRYQYPYLRVLNNLTTFSFTKNYKNLLIARNDSELVYNLLLLNICKERGILKYTVSNIKNIMKNNNSNNKSNLIDNSQTILFLPENFDRCLDIFVLNELPETKETIKFLYGTPKDYLSVLYFMFLKESYVESTAVKTRIQIILFYTHYIFLFREQIEKNYKIDYNMIHSYHDFYQSAKKTNLIKDFFKKFVPDLEKKTKRIEQFVQNKKTPEMIKNIQSKISPMIKEDVKSLIQSLDPAWNKQNIEKIYCHEIEK